MNDESKNLKRIKSGLFQRGFSLAKMAIGTGTKLTTHQLSQLWQSENEDERKTRWNEFLKERAASLSTDLGELKGSLMKAGQMLSMYGEYFLPPEANEFLKTLYSESPPLRFSEIQKILQSEWKPDFFNEIEIDSQPIGTASIGQVHKGRIKATGEWVAIKVQYTGVDKAIQSDLKAIRSFLTMLKLLPRDLPMDAVFAEVRTMLEQEMNYELEATATEAYRERLKDDRRFVIPRVYRKYSTRKVLVTSLEAGLSPDHSAVLSLPAERRNRLSSHFLDLYLTEVFEWGIVQTDPHLGNYKIRLQADGTDQVILLDFGAVREYSKDFLSPYRRMIFACLDGDRAEFERNSQQLKFLTGTEGPELKKRFFDLCQLLVEPFDSPKGGGEYDYKGSDLPKRTTAAAFQLIRSFHLNAPPQEVVFLDRKTAGVFIMMVVLGAQFNPRPYLEKHRPVVK